MKCTLNYDRGKWFCACDDLFKGLPESRNENVVTAITTFHERYYPDEAVNQNSYPWTKHNATDMDALKKAIDRYELTWHWRLLLQCLKEPEPKDPDKNKIVLCVSQIRQWQLVSCFEMEWPDIPDSEWDTLVPAIRSARKSLHRPPVFGKSHRITRAEVYASFYDPRLEPRIEEAVAKATGNPFRMSHILGRYDTYIRINRAKWDKANSQYEIDIEQIVDLDPEHGIAQIGRARTTDVCRPYGLASLPEFKSRDDKDRPQPKQLLFSSDNYCRALEQVSDVLNDPSAKQILIIAPPGSGKEDISEVFHSCRKKNGYLMKVSLAGLSEEAAAIQLFALNRKDFDDRFEKRKGVFVPKASFEASHVDGAVFGALEGTLVIDELDKADDKVRAMLLRFLESDEVSVPGTSIVVKIPKEIRPLYVFAGSKTRKEFLQLGPIDFWSRITHIVEMQHPLEIGEVSDRLRIAEDYVRLFWFKQVEAFFKDQQLLKRSPDKIVAERFEPLRQKFILYWKFFVCRSVGDFVAAELADTMCGPNKPIPSVRTIRGAVSRCFNSIFQALLYNKNADSPLEIWAAGFQSSSKRNANPLDKLAELMAAESLKESSDKHKYKRTEMAALRELRGLIRASASIQV